MVSWPLVRYVLTAAMRDKLMITLILMVLLGSSLSTFLGSAAVVEQQSFAVVFGAGGLRFLGVLGIVLFVCFYMRRAFDHKEVEFMLSRPISRVKYLLSHGFAFIVLAVLLALAVTATISLLGQPDFNGLIVWGTSAVVEFSIMAAAALFFSMVLSSAAGSALACLGLYVLARMIGILLGISDLIPENMAMLILGNVMEFISVIVPRLDLMAQTSWLVYGVEDLSSIEYSRDAVWFSGYMMEKIGLIGFITLQGIFFLFLLMAAASYDFMRKQF